MELVKTGKMNPQCDPLGEQNPLIFCTGVLAGTNFTTSHRLSVGGKKVEDKKLMITADMFEDGKLLIQKGKKKFHMVELG